MAPTSCSRRLKIGQCWSFLKVFPEGWVHPGSPGIGAMPCCLHHSTSSAHPALSQQLPWPPSLPTGSDAAAPAPKISPALPGSVALPYLGHWPQHLPTHLKMAFAALLVLKHHVLTSLVILFILYLIFFCLQIAGNVSPGAASIQPWPWEDKLGRGSGRPQTSSRLVEHQAGETG